MKTHRCPRCQKFFPRWHMVHIPCFLVRNKVLVLSLVFLMLPLLVISLDNLNIFNRMIFTPQPNVTITPEITTTSSPRGLISPTPSTTKELVITITITDQHTKTPTLTSSPQINEMVKIGFIDVDDSDRVNLRTGPNGGVIKSFYGGTEVKILSEPEQGSDFFYWIKVEIIGTEYVGWIRSDFLRYDDLESSNGD